MIRTARLSNRRLYRPFATTALRLEPLESRRLLAIDLISSVSPGENNGEQVGVIAVDGTIAAVGAPRHNEGPWSATGRVLLYETAGMTPSLLAEINSPNIGQTHSSFGQSLAIEGSTLVVGHTGYNAGRGAVYIYDVTNGSPTLLHTILNPTPRGGESFGNTLALDGDTLVVGVPNTRLSNGNVDGGTVYAYDLSGATPLLTDTVMSPNAAPAQANRFGISVALDGSQLVVGEPLADQSGGDSGTIHHYELVGGIAVLQSSLASPVVQAGANFGSSLGLEDHRLAVGMPGKNLGVNPTRTNVGSVYIYDLSTGTFNLEEFIDSPSVFSSAFFGGGVTLKGTTLAISRGGDSNNSGVVFTYDLNGPTAINTAFLPNPTPASGDFFGGTAISDQRIVISAPFDDTNGTDRGSVYFFSGNTAPSVDPQAHSVDESDLGALPFATLVASDNQSAFTYTITGGTGQSVFSLDTNTGDLTSNGALDFESTSSYSLDILVTDDVGAIDSATITIDINNVAPTIDSLTIPPSGDEGQLLNFVAAASDPGGTLVTYTWDFGDGSPTVNGANVNHAFADDGTFTVTLTATDTVSASNSQSAVITVGNLPPHVATDDDMITVNEGSTATTTGTFGDPGAADVVTLTASVGTVLDDGDGTWSWSFDSTDGPDESQVVTITATDDDDASTPTTFSLTVSNVAPSIAADSSAVVLDEGDIATNSGTFSDPGDDGITLIASIGTVLDNGDGTWSWSFDTTDGPDDSQTVTITATDADGAATATTFMLSVDNVAPSVAADAADVTFDEGDTATNSGTFSDPGDDVVKLTASIGAVLENGDGTWSWSFDTTDGPDDSQTVTITATDEDGAATPSAFTLTVDNVSPSVISMSVPGSADVFDLVSVDAQATDPGSDLLTYAWDFGDGSPIQQGSTAAYAYAMPGLFTVTVVVTDEDGGSTSQSQPIHITLLCDFDSDDLCNGADIDALQANVVTGPADPGTFDLTGDGLVTLADRDEWLALAGAENLASGNPYLLGDANLNGGVDDLDFFAWNSHKFTSSSAWTEGDFNADGLINGRDFLIWNANKLLSAEGGVGHGPEKSGAVGMLRWGSGKADTATSLFDNEDHRERMFDLVFAEQRAGGVALDSPPRPSPLRKSYI